jgi:energy-coupling factor transporter ATP-binding protein EcfA2
MYLRKLSLVNVRAFRSAEFDFLGVPGVHLIVGVNGVGKSTALDALRLLLSQVLPQLATVGIPANNFDKEDLTQGETVMNLRLEGEILNYSFVYTIDRKVESTVPNTLPVGMPTPRRGASRETKIEFLTSGTRDSVREGALDTPDTINLYLAPLDDLSGTSSIPSGNDFEQRARLLEVKQQIRQAVNQPLIVYYSPHRSLINNRTPKSGAQNPAYTEVLSSERIFSIKAFADWWRARQAIDGERGDLSSIDAMSVVFNKVVATFLTDCKDIRIAPKDDERYLLITKNGYELGIRQLSDGERSILTLALDLARRLYLANPELPNPTQQGQAIVLIDELDLHLHPGWQREVVGRLEVTFPNCQIIASTHSPQIIGEVIPDNISLVLPAQLTTELRRPTDEENAVQLNRNQIFPVSQALGMDSNWILNHIMQTPERDEETTSLIKEMFDLLARREYEKVPEAIEAVENRTRGAGPDTNRAKATLERIKIIGR